MDSIISTFHIDWKIIIAQVINFSVVFIVLYIYALKPLSKLMAERGEKISKGIEDAKINAETLEKTNVEYSKALANAKKEADKIFQESKKESENNKSKILEEAKTQVASIVEGGKKTLEAEKIKMVSEAKKEIVGLAMLATEKLLGAQKGSLDTKVLDELKSL